VYASTLAVLGLLAPTAVEFIAYAKANPGKVTMASGGNGAPSHIFGEVFKMLAGVDMLHVPYRGAGPALTGVVGGQAQVYFSPLSATIGYIRAGTLRVLAVTTAKRSDVLPDIPAVGQIIPGYEASQLYGIGAPRNTPAEIVDRLNAIFERCQNTEYIPIARFILRTEICSRRNK
jgi:tripartite-type tricarboxylate transporter receptor subunit TctC